MWGRGTYFAVNASYSYSYIHQKNNKKFFILAIVLVGDYFTSPPRNDFTAPPYKPPPSTYRYDSIKGNTQNSDIFIIYDNGKAYPSYIIELS